MQFLFGAKEERLRNLAICFFMIAAGCVSAIWVNMGS